MTGDHRPNTAAAREAVADARREAARAQARLAGAALRYADARIAEETAAGATYGSPRIKRAKPGEFVADELALMLRDQPYHVRCLLARSRRLAADLPTVWEAFQRGDLDAEQVRVIDRVARRVTEASTLAAIDEQTVDAAQTRSPKQLTVWLLRLVMQLEPLAFQQRHRRALAERRVTVVQGADGIGYIYRRSLRSRRRRHRRDARRGSAQPRRSRPENRTATPRRPIRRPATRPASPLTKPTTTTTTTKPQKSPTGWKSKTLTPTPANCSAPSCNVWMVKVRPSANRSVPRRISNVVRQPSS